MDKNRITHFKELLNNERKKRITSINDPKLGYKASLEDATSELSTYDNHPADLGTETFEAEKNISFRNNDKYIINEIESALERINKGTFGKCQDCGEDIVEDRLEIVPYARYCVDCEKINEKDRLGVENDRPIEEQSLYPPFGRTNLDNSMDREVQFDGEDAWEAVESFNYLPHSPKDKIKDNYGYVEDVEQISNQQYKNQLE